MESVVASSDKTPLIGELALGLKEGAPYVISTNDATVYCHTPQVSFDGTNVLTLNISSATQWLDPLSHTITFLVKNRGDTPLQFVSSNPAILFRRMETRLGGLPRGRHHGFQSLGAAFHSLSVDRQKNTDSYHGFRN